MINEKNMIQMLNIGQKYPCTNEVFRQLTNTETRMYCDSCRNAHTECPINQTLLFGEQVIF